ncbi:zeta toxin family protein [Nocardia sp. NPDC055321]
MALQFPSWMEPLEWLVGSDWPHGNEDLMWQMGRDLQAAADEADLLLGDIDDLLSDVRKAYPEGTGGEQILTWLQPLRDGTGPEKNGSVQELAEHFQKLATAADGHGDQLQAAKLNFYIAGGWLVAEILWALAGGPFAPALHAAAIAAGRVVFKSLTNAFIRRILTNIANRITSSVLRKISPKLIYEIVQESLEETLQGTSQEMLVQYIQKKGGHIDEYNWQAVRDNAKISAIAGAAGGAAGFHANKLFPTNMGGFRGTLNGALTGASAGAVGALAAHGGGRLVTGEWGEFDPRSLTGGALSGALPSAIHGYRGMSPDAGPVRAPGTDPTTVPGTDTPGTTPGTNPSSDSPADTNGANNNPGAGQNGANAQGANQNGATNGENGGSNQPANSGDSGGKGSDTSGANHQGSESAPSNNGESAPSNGKESGDSSGRGDGPAADTKGDSTTTGNDSNTKSDSTTSTDGKTDDSATTDGKTEQNSSPDTNSDNRTETRSEADTKADQTGTALKDSSSQPNTAASLDTNTTTSHHTTNTTTTTANATPNTTAPNTTAPTTNAPNTSTATTANTSTTTSTANTSTSTSTTTPNSADTRAGDPAKSAPGPRADVGAPRPVAAPVMTTRASIGDATFAHPGAGIPIQAAQTGVEAAAKTEQAVEHQGPQSSPDAEQAVPIPVPMLPIGVDPPAPTPPADTTAEPQSERQMAKNFKANSTLPGGQITFGELSPKAKQLVNALAENAHIPISPGEVSIAHLAELQKFAGVEHAIAQNKNGDLRLFRGGTTRTRIPDDLKGEYDFIVHTHPEDRMPGPPSQWELYMGTHSHDSMDFDLRTKTSSYTEAVVSRDGQVRFFNNEGVFDLPVGEYPKGGPISDRGYVVPVPNLDSDFVGEKKISQDSDPDPLTENDPTPDTDRPESKSTPDTRQPGQDPGARQPAPDRSDTAPNVDTHLDEVLATHPDPDSILTDLDGTTTVAAIADQMGITDPEQRQALQDVFEASRDNAAPFIVKVASDMLTNLMAAAALNPDLRVVFLGRDGHSLAMAMSQLDPAFVAQHGHEVTLSRALVETAVQDLEKNEGLDVSDVDGFRNTKGKVDPDSVDGAFVRLTEYFERLGIPMGVPGSDVALVDTSYKGTVQELLNAIYPETNFQGHFMFYAASPVDPHPDNKLGYALDLDVENGNDGYPVKEMPADPARTFQQQDALGSIEEVFHGPLGSPKSIGPDGLPSQELQRHESDPLVGLNPETVSDRFSDPLLREAAKRVALLPVAQIAHDIATQRAAGVDVDADLQARYDNYVDQVRAWVEGDPSVNPKFAEVMDSFVRRADKSEVRSLADLIDQAGLNPDEARQVWRDYADNTTLADKKAFVQQFADAHPNPESTREITRPPENNQPHPESTDPNDSDQNDPLQSGGSTRPRDVLDPEIQGAWANAAYDAFRASPSDVDDMHRNLADVERLDGTTGFTRQEIEQVKRHLFEQEHQLSVFDDDGNVVGYESRRFDADPDIAEAWMRLSRGVPLPADIRLLEHELAEADFLRRNPDATYREAHAYANSQSNWESDIPNRTGENYERWAAKDGGVHRVPEIDPNTDNPDVPVREQPGESRPPSGDPDGRHGRQTGGRLEQPTGDEGRGPHSGPVENGRDLAGRGRDSSLEPGRREEAGNRPPTPPQDSARPDRAQQEPGHSPQPNMAVPQPNFQQSQNPHIPNPTSSQLQQANDARQFREALRNKPPENHRVLPVSTTNAPNSDTAYQFRRYENQPGGPVGVVGLKLQITHDGTVSQSELMKLWERAQMAVDLQFNHAQKLLSGDRVLVDLEYAIDPATANVKLHVGQNAPGTVSPNMDLGSLAGQISQQLGLSPQQGPGLDPAAVRKISNDIAKANTPARFRRLEEGHRYQPRKLKPVEHAAYQHAVEDALRRGNQFMIGADPRTNPYGQLINDGGPAHPGRSNNCLVQSLAALSSFHGDPQVGPPRYPDLLPDGTIDRRSGEADGLQRAEAFLGGKWQDFNTPGKPIGQQFADLHNWIRHLGPGSSALIHNTWQAVDPQTGQPLFNPDGSPKPGPSHATVIVFPFGAKEPVWWDPQQGTMSDTPPPGMVARTVALEFMTSPTNPGAAHAPSNNQGTRPAVSGPDLSLTGTVGDPSVQSGMGSTSDPDTRTDSERPEPGPDRDGDRREQRDSPRVPELVDRDGDRGLHPVEGDRATVPERGTDLPAPDPSESDTDTRGPRDDSVPDSSRLDGNPSTPDTRVPTDHRQADTAPRTDRERSDDRGVLGGLETEAAERSLARNGLDGVLTPDSTATQPNTNESVETDTDRPADLTDDAGTTPRTQDPDDSAPSPQEQAILDAVERLTPAERDALQDYAGDAYNEINRHLRFGEPLDTVSPETIDLIRSGLDKLPDYVGPVKRSIMLSPEQMESFWNANRKGAVVEDPAFVSTSKTKFKWNPNVKLTILSATGKDISYLQPPAKRGEQEVLIPDGRQFRVLNRVMDENGVMHVTWAEIADAPRSPDQGDTNPVVAQMDQEDDQPFPQHLLPNLDTPFSLDFGDPAPSGTTPAAPDTAARGDDPPRDTHAPTTKPEESPDSRERRSTVPDESGSQPADPDSTPPSENDRSPRPDDEWSRMEPRQIAEELENRWDVEAVGFDNPDLDPEAVREFARAVDTMLSRYPDVDLERVVIEPLGRNTYARAMSYKNSDGTMSVDSLALNARYATDPELMARHVAEDEADGHLVPGSADRPVYSTLVHEFAHAIAFEGQERSAATAQETLEKYYEATRGGMDRAGFDAWLSQLSGYSFDDNGLLDGDEALAEAFTDVELNGEAASEPAKVLFWHLLDGARQDSPIPNLFDVLPADVIARPSGLPTPDTGTPKPVAPVTFSHADNQSNHQRKRSEEGSPESGQQPNTDQEPDATELSESETSQPETSESPQNGTPAVEPSPDIPENDRPNTLTDHLRSRFEQLRSLATDIILAEQDSARHDELPSLRADYASLLDKLGMLDPATADTSWRLLDQHQSALAEYLSTNHAFLVPSVSNPVLNSDESATTAEPAGTGPDIGRTEADHDPDRPEAPEHDSRDQQPTSAEHSPERNTLDPHAQEVRDKARLRTNGRDALAWNSPVRELSSADIDQIERIEALRDDLNRPGVDPVEVTAKLRTELEAAGVLRRGKQCLRNDGPAMQRRALLTEAGIDVVAIADEIGLDRPRPPRTDNEGLPLRGDHADPDAVTRRDVTFEEVDAVVPDALIRALEKFGVSRSVAVDYIVDVHNDRSRQRYLPDLEGLARKYNIPLGDVFAIDLYTTKLYYEELNRRLRANMDVDTVEELQQAVNESLSKLPPAAVPELFRSLSIDSFDLADFLAKYTTGAVIDWEAFTSVADEEGGTWWGEPNENILFKITGGVAFDISDFADGLNYKDPANEGKELLLPAGKVVRVESITPHVLPDGTTGYVIELEVLGGPSTTIPATTASDPTGVLSDPSTGTPSDTTQHTPEFEQTTAPSDVVNSVPPSDPAGAGPIDTGDTDGTGRNDTTPSEETLPQQDSDDIPPIARGVDPVTPEQLERIFHEQIVPKLLSGATSVPDTETPEVVVVGGQMGAGKSTMIADVVATFADRGGVTQISGDDFFKFHPRYPELMATHDADAIRHLLADARPWFRMALEHVMANRQNVILELAMGDPVKEAGLIREFVDNGYTARAEVMAVSEPQSRLSTINRYLSERIDDGVHRYTPPWLHDASYTGSQQMVGELESDAPPVRLESLTVRSRTETLYQNARDEDGNWAEPPRAAEVLSGERDRPWTPDEKQLYQEQLAQVRQRMAEMAAQRPAETETLETLGRDLRATEDNARPRFDTETPPVRLDEDTGRPPEPADTETATRQTQTAQAQQQVTTVAEQQHEFLRAAEQRDLDASDPAVHEQIRATYARAHELVDLATASNKAALRILAVIDEWHPSKGGVIAVNKNLCEALAALGHDVFVRVGHELTGNEGADTVTLIAPRTSDPNTPLRDQLVSDMGDLPAGIDAVIGHTRFSGPAARDIRNAMYPEATLVHMVHMVTDALGRVQGKPEKAVVNHEIEADLVSTSDVAVGVGPALSEEAARLAAMTDASPVLHQLNPGVEFFDQVRPPAERQTMRMLVFGRADDPVKGAMQAAKMVQALNARGIDVDLIVRGVPEAKVADQRRLLTRAAGREVDVRPYTLDRDEILADMRDANVVLMPSLAEGFGLVATEAAGAGVPMVLPSTSGAGRFFGAHTVFPSELTDGMFVEQGYESPVSVEAWAAVLESQLSDQDGAWDRALQLQQILRDQQFTWGSAATALIDATRAVPPADKPVAGIPGQSPDVGTPPSARAGLPSAPSNPVANSELSSEDTIPRRGSEPDSSASGRASVPDSSAPGRASVPDSSTPSEPTTPNMTPPADESTMTGPQPEQTPAGASFHPDPADPVAELARRVQPDPDRFTVDAHVDANGNFRVGDRTYTPEEFANLLRRTGWDGTTPIRLIGCDAATNGAATRLAQALGVDVLAPTKPAWTDARGNVFTSSTEIGPDGNRRPRIPPDGVWETHHADGSKTKATDDGYAPGSRADSARPTDADSARDRAAGPIDPGKTNESTDAASSHDSSTSSGPRGSMADPQPTWHGQTAAKMRHYRLPVEDVSALSPAEQLEALRQRTQELANEARKPDMTEAEKQAYSRMSFPKGQNKIPQGCAGTLLHNDTMTSHTSVTKMDNQAQPLTHPVLQALYDQVRADYVAGKIQEIGNGHGKCAEVALISDRLLQLEAAGIRIDSVEAARRALEGAQINTRRIGDFRDKEGNVINHHGQPIPPCDSCKHVLPQLGIEPV